MIHIPVMITIIKKVTFSTAHAESTKEQNDAENNQIFIWHPINKFIKKKGDFNYDKMGM